MKVFISWSGTLSQKVAKLLNEWIPNVIQSAEPWFSGEDISKGEVWANTINSALADTAVGIICLTKDNLNAPWILFEAGALSKGLTKNRVCTFLIDLEPKDLKPPLAQFNATSGIKEDIAKLLNTINEMDKEKALPDERIRKSFERWWPDFHTKLGEIILSQPASEIDVSRTQEDIMGEILETVRSISNSVQQSEGGLVHDVRWPVVGFPNPPTVRTLGELLHPDPQSAQMLLGDLRWAPMLMEENIRVFGHQGTGEGLILLVSKMPSDMLARNLQTLADVYGRKLKFVVPDSPS